MRFYRLLLKVFLGYLALCNTFVQAAPSGVYLGSGPTSKNADSSVGVNLHDPQSWNPGLLFVDMAIKATKWIPHSCSTYEWDTKRTIQTDVNGWVTAVPDDTCPGMMMVNEPDTLLGTYVLIWEGEGTLAGQVGPATGLKCSSSSCQQTGQNRLHARSIGNGPHRATFELKTQGTTTTDLRILAFNKKLPIKNIRVIVPGGVPGKSSTELDYSRYCKTDRGPFSADNLNGTSPLKSGETCFDFERVYWDRFQDSPGQMHNPKVVFHPLTLTGLQNFRLLRAMDWTHTNNSPVRSWLERTNYQHQNQIESNHGAAFEYLASLANVLGADLWINIPHLANDDYVRSLAGFLRDNVHSDLKVYVEYSNELWNGIFAQNKWTGEQAILRYPNAESPWHAWTQFCSDQTVKIADLFRQAFAAKPGRLVNVLAGQAVTPGSAEAMLKWNNAKVHFDAYAIAPYFGYELDGDTKVRTYSLDKIFDILTQDAIPAARAAVRNNISMLAKLGNNNLRLITYEGGQHVVGNGALQDDSQILNLFTSANRDPRMGAATEAYLRGLRADGINEFCYYEYISAFGKYGSWGLWERETDMSAPKWQAVNNFRQSNPCWWNNCLRRTSLAGPPQPPPPPPTPTKPIKPKPKPKPKPTPKPKKPKKK